MKKFNKNMRLFNFKTEQKNIILSLLTGGFLLFELMAPIYTEAAIIVTGSGIVENYTDIDSHYENHHDNDTTPIIASHPLCHSGTCQTTTTTRPHIVMTTTTTHPLCHTTYNCNTNTWQCVEANCGSGQYTSLSTCQANCQAPVTHYACNTSTWQCYQDSHGPYTSLSTCQANCTAPIRYSCNTNTWQCYQDYYGQYTSLSNCQANCTAPIRYSCNTNTWQCYQDYSGPYTSYSSCLDVCKQEISPLSVSCYASPSSAQTNQTITFYSNVSGGLGNYSYYWSGSAYGYNSYYQTSFSNIGTYTAYLTVSDSQGRSASTSCNAYIYSSGNQCINPPTINLWADKYSLSQGETTYLRWGSNYTSYCVASNGWTGTKSTSGIESISPSNNTTYTLTCYGHSNCGSISQSVTIYTTPIGTNLSLTKLGRNLSSGSRVYSKVIQITQGDVIEFHLTVNAGSNTDLHNVIVKDPLPSTLTYMSGTTKINGITQPDTITTTGLSLGTIYRGTSKTITFQASTNAYSPTYLSQTNTAEATADNQNKVTDSATITYGLVAGAATVKTGSPNAFLISSIISLILTFAIWYYLKFNPKGQLALAKVESKTRDIWLAYTCRRTMRQN
ncbi:MAG: hypothetical protein WC320_00750 [Candidatus Paceibacterota bacterium]|jgi:uncharacterized repeat protein (TIGR01451 family)